MPEKGYRTITVRDELYERLEKLANENQRSIAGQIEFMAKEVAA
jgi:hypothetical protein